MKCIILSAGYTGEDFGIDTSIPRTLLPIQGDKTIMDFIIENVSSLKDVDQIFVTTNNRFYEALSRWKENRKFEKEVKIINDTTNNNNEMLGAVGDIEYTINYEDIDDDLLIILGDNLFSFTLEDFIQKFYRHKSTIIGVQEENDKAALTSVGIVEVDDKNRVIGFEEKPRDPKTNMKSLGIYLFPKEILPSIQMYLEEGNRPETPGYFIKYLHTKQKIYAHSFKGNWFDINTEKELSKAKERFK